MMVKKIFYLLFFISSFTLAGIAVGFLESGTAYRISISLMLLTLIAWLKIHVVDARLDRRW